MFSLSLNDPNRFQIIPDLPLSIALDSGYLSYQLEIPIVTMCYNPNKRPRLQPRCIWEEHAAEVADARFLAAQWLSKA